jgi:hypothetical protein
MVTALATILPLTLIGAWPASGISTLNSLILDIPNRYAFRVARTDGWSHSLAAYYRTVSHPALPSALAEQCLPSVSVYLVVRGDYIAGVSSGAVEQQSRFILYLAISFCVTCIAGFAGTRVLWIDCRLSRRGPSR